MEAPPQTPLPPPPAGPHRFGRTILLIVLAPLGLLGLGMAVAGGLHIERSEGYFTFVFFAGCLCAIFGAAFICVAATKSMIARIFIFLVSALLLSVVYTFCITAGCTTVNGPMNLH